MCGIWFYYGQKEDIPTGTAAAALWPRGPEQTSVKTIPGYGTAVFTRLAINGLNPAGMQPMSVNKIHWMCNGEIYNWKELAIKYRIVTVSGSDCEIIGRLYKKIRDQGLGLKHFFRLFDGVFSCVIVDEEEGRVIVARDPYGVRPLYKGSGPDGIFFASEIKALQGYGCEGAIEAFEPGCYEIYQGGTRVLSGQYHTIPFLKILAASEEAYYPLVREALTTAVRKRMLSDRPVAALVSGGVDSSIVAALVAAELRAAGSTTPLNTFSIGFTGSSDLAYARKVATWIGSKHHEIVVTPEEFFEAVPTVIRAIESFDTTTVRASIGNYLVAKAVREQTDCKVVFNGDGSDEVWGSYLYFYNAPSEAAFEAETERLLMNIHIYDVLRSDRSISSHGLEARTPFLDKQFVAVAKAVPTAFQRPGPSRPEKSVLRAAFADMALLPNDVLYRRKEAFSDGVSGQEKSWYELAQEFAAAAVPPDWKERVVASSWSGPQPTTPEQFYYRSVYEAAFPGVGPVNVPAFWLPRWSGGATDPSARTLAVYQGVL